MCYEGGLQGIVTVISAFMIQVFTAGITGTIGMYNVVFLDHFQVSASEVSMVSALNAGVFLGSGPIVSFLMTKFCYRQIVLSGSILIAIGLLAVPVSPNIYVMYMTIGVVAGFGSCCAYIPSHTLCGLYYDKYRSLATGIASCGYGFGYAVMPVIAGILIQTYAWKGSYIMVAGLCLHLFVFGALLKQPPKTPKLADGEDDEAAKTFTNEHIEILPEDENLELDNYYKRDEVVRVSDENKSNQSHSDTNSVTMTQEDRFGEFDSQPLPDSIRHFHIFKNYNFVVYFIANFFWNASCFMKGAFVPKYFDIRGNSILDVSWLVTCYGLGTFFGGILGSVLGNIKGVNRIFLYIGFCFLLGLFTIIIPFGQSFTYFAAMMVSTGLSLGVLLGLLVVVLADLIGIDSLGNGIGYLLLSNGLGSSFGPIVAGALVDSTQSYELVLYVSGTMAFISMAVMCLIPARQHLKTRTKH